MSDQTKEVKLIIFQQYCSTLSAVQYGCKAQIPFSVWSNFIQLVIRSDQDRNIHLWNQYPIKLYKESNLCQDKRVFQLLHPDRSVDIQITNENYELLPLFDYCWANFIKSRVQLDGVERSIEFEEFRDKYMRYAIKNKLLVTKVLSFEPWGFSTIPNVDTSTISYYKSHNGTIYGYNIFVSIYPIILMEEKAILDEV